MELFLLFFLLFAQVIMTSCLFCVHFAHRVHFVCLICVLFFPTSLVSSIFLITKHFFLFQYNQVSVCVAFFSYFWTYVWFYVFFLSLFSLFKITRLLLITSTVINTKITCIITVFTIIIWLIAKFLLENYNIKLTSFDNTFTIYLTSIPNNDITHRAVMFP